MTSDRPPAGSLPDAPDDSLRTLRVPPARRGERVALAAGSVVGGFEILGVVGSGGFSIVYLARDPVLDRRVAIKEYLPGQLAERGPGGDVLLRESAHAPLFEQGLDTFMNEARLLARFDHPSLLRVHRFWRERGTAYMAMPYLEGRTLLATRHAMPRPPDEAWLRSVLGALLEAVETLHEASCFHRDISPDNILLLPSGTPVLLDFGSARTIRGDGTHQLTAVLKPAYAPIEQYAESPQLRQGPWTDLYAWGAVARFCVTGRPPTPATVRAVEDLLRPLAAEVRAMARTVPGLRYSPTLTTAIDWALALRPAERPQSVAQLRPLLDGRRALPPPRRLPGDDPTMGWPPEPHPSPLSGSGWAPATARAEAEDDDSALGGFAGEAPAGVPPLARSRRAWRVPAGLALACGALLAGAGWRMLDQRAADQSLDLMARSAAAASAGGARAVPGPLPPAPIGVARGTTPPGPALGAATAPAGAALTAPPQPLPAQAAATLRPVAAPATLLDGLPEAPAGAAPDGSALATGTAPAQRAAHARETVPGLQGAHGSGTEAGADPGPHADTGLRADGAAPEVGAGALPAAGPFEEILDGPVRDVAPAPAAPARRGAALLGSAPPRAAAGEPAAPQGRAQRSGREPALNDAVPDRRSAPPRSKGAVAASAARGPRAFCARQERYTDYFCMKRQCELPRYRHARDCMALRRDGWWGFMRGQWRTASQ